MGRKKRGQECTAGEERNRGRAPITLCVAEESVTLSLSFTYGKIPWRQGQENLRYPWSEGIRARRLRLSYIDPQSVTNSWSNCSGMQKDALTRKTPLRRTLPMSGTIHTDLGCSLRLLARAAAGENKEARLKRRENKNARWRKKSKWKLFVLQDNESATNWDHRKEKKFFPHFVAVREASQLSREKWGIRKKKTPRFLQKFDIFRADSHDL